MLRILLICPTFPPTNFVSSRRPAALTKYLTRLGWNVSVLTASLDECGGGTLMSPEETARFSGFDPDRVSRARSLPPRRKPLLRVGASHLVLPFSRARRLSGMMLRAVGYDWDVPDVVWATYPCAASFLAARELERQFGILWIADFRDTPTQYHWLPKALRWIAMKRLAGICRTASAWTTLSEAMATDLRAVCERPVVVIRNGYDPELYSLMQAGRARDVFRIVYTGTVRPGRDLNPVVRAVQQLEADGVAPTGAMEICLYGGGEWHLEPDTRRSLGQTVRINGYVGPTESFRLQTEATVLLVISAPQSSTVVPAKVEEYLGAGRPILAYPKDPMGTDPVLEATGMGVSCDSVDELKAVLARWYREWEATGDISVPRRDSEIEKWARPVQAKCLAALCEEVVAACPRKVGGSTR